MHLTLALTRVLSLASQSANREIRGFDPSRLLFVCVNLPLTKGRPLISRRSIVCWFLLMSLFQSVVL